VLPGSPTDPTSAKLFLGHAGSERVFVKILLFKNGNIENKTWTGIIDISAADFQTSLYYAAKAPLISNDSYNASSDAIKKVTGVFCLSGFYHDSLVLKDHE
jgi:hypothetical protein